jgi:SpoIID/LytB domain protein
MRKTKVVVFFISAALVGCTTLEQFKLPKVNLLILREAGGAAVEKKEVPTRKVPGYRVQIGAMKSEEGAKGMVKACEDLIPGCKPHIVYEGDLYKIRIGDFTDKNEANKVREQLVKLGYTDCWVTPDTVEVPVSAEEEGLPDPTKWHVQVAATRLEESAKSVKEKIVSAGIKDKVYIVKEGDLFKIRVGDLNTREEAEKLKSEIISKTPYSDAWLISPQTLPPSTAAPTKGISFTKEVLDNIRIGVLRSLPEATVYSNGNFALYDKNNVLISTASAWDMWVVRVEGPSKERAPKTVFRLAPAAYSSEENASAEAEKLRRLIDEPVYVIKEPPWFKIRVGDFATREEAEKAKTKLIALGYTQTWVHQMTLPPEEGALIALYDPEGNKVGVYRDVIFVKPLEEGKNVGVSGRLFHGNLEVKIGPDGLLVVINRLNIEKYLYGVVPAEIGTNAPFEALKAQAVAARTEALAKLGRHESEGFDLCSEVHCQVYGGASRESVPTNKAVDETAGEVITYEGSLASTLYHACCGGYTEDNSNVYSGAQVPYLVGVPCFPEGANKEFTFPLDSEEAFTKWVSTQPQAYCSHAKSVFRWEKVYTKTQLENLISKKYNIGSLLDIKLGPRGKSGRLKWIEVVGTNGTYRVERELQIRNLFGGPFEFRSGAFVIEKSKTTEGEEVYKFIGAGWGHGVGMCQDGAIGMAREGKDYKEILKHYFRGTEIKKIY